MLVTSRQHFVTLRERLIYLRTLPLLGNMPSADLAVLAEYARERFFRKGEHMLQEGIPAHAIQLIVQGAVQVSRRGRPFRLFGPRDAVGAFAVLARTDEGVQATAVEDSLVLEIHRDALLDAFEDHFSMLHHVLRETSRLLLEERRQLPGEIRLPRDWDASVSCPARPLDLVERIFFLRRSMPFARSSLVALAALARRTKTVRLEPGTQLWGEGEASHTTFLLVSGSVAGASRTGSHRYRFGPGAGLGALDAIAGMPRAYTATTESSVAGLELGVEDLMDVLEDHSEAAMSLLAAHASQVIAAFEQRAEIDPDSVRPGQAVAYATHAVSAPEREVPPHRDQSR